jgi:long-chain acyl-CoA synthetase
MTIGYLPWNQSAAQAELPCVRDDNTELTYRQFAQRVDSLAAQLSRSGIGPGDVLAVMLPNRVELILAIFAAWRLGAVATPINPAFTATEANFQISDSGARLVVNTDAGSPTGGLPALHVADIEVAATTDSLPTVTLHESELALLVYTSGSTGKPKGVMLSHGNLLAQAEQIVQHMGVNHDDHCLLILPLFHCNAILVSVLAPMLVGAQTTVMGRFSPRPFLHLIETVRPTYFSAVPAIYAMLAALPEDVVPDTSSLRMAICGAAPVSQELLTMSGRRFGFVMVEGYGLTEGTCCSACNPVDGVRKLGTVGPALAGQRIAIMSAEDEILPVGERGEVVISGPTVMQGYLGKPEETATTIRDGWLHTGDVGRLDEDGYLTLVDRIKDMIIRGGENLYPKEIESTLHEVDGVLEAAVVGRPDPVLGEVPVAFVALYPDATVTEEDLLEHCRTHLTRVKVPVSITIVGSIPRNPIGKIDKPMIRRSLQPQAS